MKMAAAKPGSLCAIVPAAGKGSRLGMNVPKVFVPLLPSSTIWDAIHETLGQVADRIVLVLSPQGNRFVESRRATFLPSAFAKTELACQSEPLGMGDAIFGVADLWCREENLLIVWGDQFNLKVETLRACIALHATREGPALTLPLVRIPKPYVEYVFTSAGSLEAIRQSREGDACEPDGLADMGVFLLSGGQTLIDEWNKYRELQALGAETGEINFIPFLVYLSTVAGWPVNRYEGSDPAEALGINTPEDLAEAQRIVREKRASSGD